VMSLCCVKAVLLIPHWVGLALDVKGIASGNSGLVQCITARLCVHGRSWMNATFKLIGHSRNSMRLLNCVTA
jgi:hypothetical protein